MKMIRKTVSLDDELYRELEKEGVLTHFKNFSDLVSSSLKQTIGEIKKQNYARQIAEMANDPQVQEDIAQVQEDFKYADGEIDAF
jgi:metal-responsive CopG/Arc/MetJ family transcriptional regulator